MLTTRCPHCGTSFRVRPEQLRVRAGRVRCGHCQAPFSALESLIEDAAEPDTSEASAAASSPEQDMPPPGEAPAPATVPDPPVAPLSPEPARPRHEIPVTAYPVWSGQREIAPPIPELEPGSRPMGSTLDFDLDGDPGEATRPAAPAGEATEVSPDWTWHDSGPSPGGDSTVERLEDLEAEDQVPERPLPAPAIDIEPEPVFVTAFASPGGRLPPMDDNRTEPTDRGDPDDTVFEDPDDILASAPAPEPVEDRTVSLRARLEGTDTPAAPPLQAPAAHAAYDWDATDPPARRWPWVLGVSVLAVCALAQGLLLERHDIAREWPATRPVLEAVCAEIGCVMPWPRAKGQISILAHDLHPQAGVENRYELSGTLRNAAAFDQEYPHLELTLTDVFNRAVARRVLPPEQWVPADARRTPAFPAGGDLGFTLGFEAANLPISGYKLYAFYP